MTYPISIDANRIVLRDFQADDLDGCMTIVGDDRVTNSLSFDSRTRDDHAERLAADIERAQTNPRPDHYLAVIEQATEEFLGFVRIEPCFRPRKATVPGQERPG